MRQIKKIHKQIIKQLNANRLHMCAMLQRGTKFACNITERTTDGTDSIKYW